MSPPTLLCVANYPANIGYAWNFIEGLYARVADHLAELGVRTLVAYPALDGDARCLRGSRAEPRILDASLRSLGSVRAVSRAIRSEGIRALYLADRPTRTLAYAVLRSAGLKSIVVHDHASGGFTPARGLARGLKSVAARVPVWNADAIIAVSDFVARRQRDSGCVPAERVIRVHNGVVVPPPSPDAPARLRSALGLPDASQVVAFAGRLTAEKGVDVLIRAFGRVQERLGVAADLVIVGEGPARAQLEKLRAGLGNPGAVRLAGYRKDAADLLGGADVCVIPSVWQEAFGLAVLEPMARGRCVIATRTGGVPEVVEHGRSGLLVEPGNVEGLAKALEQALGSKELRERLGAAARERIASQFTPDRTLAGVLGVLEPLLGVSTIRALPL